MEDVVDVPVDGVVGEQGSADTGGACADAGLGEVVGGGVDAVSVVVDVGAAVAVAVDTWNPVARRGRPSARHRDLVEALHELYHQAGYPGTRAISDDSREPPGPSSQDPGAESQCRTPN
jgi:hypothetical protein